MQIPKPTAADRTRFEALVPDQPAVTVKPMFGNVGAFVNGNMFMGLFGSDLGIKLAPADAQELLKVDGAGPYGPIERPMGGYVTLPATPGPAFERAWIARSLAYVAGLPPKAARK
jgi:TfoX/Sxy family transcriptional regulator of competence genes